MRLRQKLSLNAVKQFFTGKEEKDPAVVKLEELKVCVCMVVCVILCAGAFVWLCARMPCVGSCVGMLGGVLREKGSAAS